MEQTHTHTQKHGYAGLIHSHNNVDNDKILPVARRSAHQRSFVPEDITTLKNRHKEARCYVLAVFCCVCLWECERALVCVYSMCTMLSSFVSVFV